MKHIITQRYVTFLLTCQDMPLDSRGHASFLMVNPGFLTRFNSGGSFARMVIGPIEPKHIKLGK